MSQNINTKIPMATRIGRARTTTSSNCDAISNRHLCQAYSRYGPVGALLNAFLLRRQDT